MMVERPGTVLAPAVIRDCLAFSRAADEVLRPYINVVSPRPRNYAKQALDVSLAFGFGGVVQGAKGAKHAVGRYGELVALADRVRRNKTSWSSRSLQLIARVILDAGDFLLENEPLNAAFWAAADADAAEATRSAWEITGGQGRRRASGRMPSVTLRQAYATHASVAAEKIALLESGAPRLFAQMAFHAAQRLTDETHRLHGSLSSDEFIESAERISADALRYAPQFVFAPQGPKGELLSAASSLTEAYGADKERMRDMTAYIAGALWDRVLKLSTHLPEAMTFDFWGNKQEGFAAEATNLVLALRMFDRDDAASAGNYVRTLMEDSATRENPTPRKRVRKRWHPMLSARHDLRLKSEACV